MISPKEEAEQLVREMYAVHSNSASDITLYFAKQCALIAVNKIIKILPHPDYWKLVKKEIEKL
jgi:hypothetical protein